MTLLHVRFLCLSLPFLHAALLLGLCDQAKLATVKINRANRSPIFYSPYAIVRAAQLITAIDVSKLSLCSIAAPVVCSILSSQPAASLCSDPHSTRKEGSLKVLSLSMKPSSKPFSYYRAKFLGSEELPQRLHKFYSINNNGKPNLFFTDMIKRGYLWHANPETLNDPFDCYKALVEYNNPTVETLRWMAEQSGYRNEYDIDNEFYRLWNNKEQVVEAYRVNTPIWHICSFTTNLVSNLMWSHYANCHTGVCLTFDIEKLASVKLLTCKVMYEEDFKPVNFFEQAEESIINMILTKSLEWGYENEYRSFEDKEGEHYFDRSALVGITFGCKTNAYDIAKVRSLVETSGYTNLIWGQAKMQSNSFNLAIDRL